MELPEDEERNRNQIAQEELQSMYNIAKQSSSQLCAKVQEILDGEPSFQLDKHLKEALQIALLRAERLKSRVEQA